MTSDHSAGISTLHITFHIEERGYAFSDNGPPELYFGATIDGTPAAKFTTVVDPQALVDSLAGGEHYIFTCACGQPIDAGIKTPVRVTHDGGTTRWQAEKPALDVVFSAAQYRAAVEDGMVRAEELVRQRPELEGWMPPRLKGIFSREATFCDSEEQARALFDRVVAASAAVPGFTVYDDAALVGLSDDAQQIRARSQDVTSLIPERHTIVARERELVIRVWRQDRPGVSRLTRLQGTARYQLESIRWEHNRRPQPYPFPIRLD